MVLSAVEMMMELAIANNVLPRATSQPSGSFGGGVGGGSQPPFDGRATPLNVTYVPFRRCSMHRHSFYTDKNIPTFTTLLLRYFTWNFYPRCFLLTPTAVR